MGEKSLPGTYDMSEGVKGMPGSSPTTTDAVNNRTTIDVTGEVQFMRS